MPKRSSDFEFRQHATMSQLLGFLQPDFQELAGSDPETSIAIENIKILGKHKILDIKQPGLKLILDLLNGRRMALFATSPNTNEISKLGFMLPTKKTVYSGDEDE